MPIGRVPEQDHMEQARATLIWELDHATGKDLYRAVREGERYNHIYPDDAVVESALDRAKKRQAWSARS